MNNHLIAAGIWAICFFGILYSLLTDKNNLSTGFTIAFLVLSLVMVIQQLVLYWKEKKD